MISTEVLRCVLRVTPLGVPVASKTPSLESWKTAMLVSRLSVSPGVHLIVRLGVTPCTKVSGTSSTLVVSPAAKRPGCSSKTHMMEMAAS